MERTRLAAALAAALSLLVVRPAGAAPASRPAPAKKKAGPLVLRLGGVAEITPLLQYRLRFLAHSGKDLAPGGTFDAFSHRARFGARVRVLRWFTAMIQLQDVRLWGEETNTLGDYRADGFDVHQAWAAADCPHGLGIKAGRQEINLDDERLVGSVGWTDQARSFDALLLRYTRGGFKLRIWWARTGEEDALKRDPADPRKILAGSVGDSDFAGLWARYDGLAFARPSLYVLYDGVRERLDTTPERDRVTVGLNVDGAPVAGLTYRLQFFYQFGDLAGKDIRAWMATGRVGYAIPVALRPALEVFGDYLSGDDDLSDGTVKAFHTLFPTNHKFYGFMDYFLNIPVHTKGRGLIDVGGRVKVVPVKGLVAFVDIHHFRLAQPFAAPGGDRTVLGNEIDVLVKYKVNRFFAVEGVFATMLPEEALACVRGGCQADPENEYFGYLQTNFTL